MPIYNAAGAIENSLLSAIKQDYENKEIIVIDGGSTDGTQEIIELYRNEVAYYISESDRGISDAINKGVHAATGQVIAYLAAGDWFANSHVLTDAMQSMNTQDDAYVADLLFNRGHKWVRMHSNPDLTQLYRYCSIFAPATFIKKNIYEEVGGYSEEFISSADYDFWLKMYTSGMRIHFGNQIITLMADGGISSDPTKYGFKENRKIQIKYGASPLHATFRYYRNTVVYKCVYLMRTLGIEEYIRRLLKPSTTGLSEQELLEKGIDVKTPWFL